MRNDYLHLFNLSLVEPITTMSDDELWDFILANQHLIKQYNFKDKYPKTGFLYAYPHGIEHFRKCYLRDIEEYREGMIFTLVVDFCFGQESVKLDYWAQSGFLDNADSCDVKTSDEIMPPVDEDSEAAHWAGEYFHLLEPHHLEKIIRAMEKAIDKSTVNTNEDIGKIKAMKGFCLKNDNYKAAYIYSNY